MKYAPPSGSIDPDAAYVGKNPGLGIQGSKVPPMAIEHPQREIIEVIEAAGITPSELDLTQLLQAIRFLSRSATVANARRFLTSSGTWTKPAGLSHIEILMLGAGGGGSNSATIPGAGGGNGALIEGQILAAFLGSSEAYEIGGGGASVPANNTGNGGGGGNTTFAGLIAGGGSGGTGYAGSGSAAGGNGGSSTIPSDSNVRCEGFVGAIGYAGDPYRGLVSTTPKNPYGRGGLGGFSSIGSGVGVGGLIIIKEFLQ